MYIIPITLRCLYVLFNLLRLEEHCEVLGSYRSFKSS